MLCNWIFLLILSLLAATALPVSACPTSSFGCDFYHCMEAQRPCGPRGYWQDFGIPYCEVFVRDEQKFSIESQLWLQDVRECLQVRLGETTEYLKCSEIKDQALDSHVSCYVDTGFCNLSTSDKFKIMWYLKGALRDWRTWKEAELLRKACQRP